MAAPNIFEDAINSASNTISKLNKQIDQIFNGTRKYTQAQLTGSISVPQRLADIGVIGVVDVIAGIDMCQLLSYISDIITNSNGYKFDPNSPPLAGSSAITKKMWLLQDFAYEIKQNIDQFNAANGQRVNVSELTKLIPVVVNDLTVLFDPKIDGSIVDVDIQASFSAITVISNYFDVALNVLQYYVSSQGSVQNLQTNPIGGTVAGQYQNKIKADYQKIVGFLNNIDSLCGKIIKIDIYNPTGLSSVTYLVTTFANAQIQSYITQVNKVVGSDLQKLIPMLENLQNQCTAVQRYCSMVLSTVRTMQTYLRIGTILMKVFTVIVNFLKILPVPNEFTTVGITTEFSEINKSVNDLIDRIEQDLKAINSLLTKIVSLISGISLNVNKISKALAVLIANLESCSNQPPGLVDDLKSTLSQLNYVFGQLNDFVVNSQKSNTSNNLTFGGYTIQIITEELLKSSTNIPRRYGIAIDSNGFEVVKSTPTFATLDSIIIDDVKLILESKKLIKVQSSAFNQSQQSTIQQSLSYLESNTLPQNFSVNLTSQLDPNGNSDENSGLGLNAFVNSQKGGNALRQRMMAAMAVSSAQLQQNLTLANQGH